MPAVSRLRLPLLVCLTDGHEQGNDNRRRESSAVRSALHGVAGFRIRLCLSSPSGHTPAVEIQSSGLFRSGLLKARAGEIALLQRLADSAIVAIAHWFLCGLYSEATWTQSNTLATAIALISFYLVGEARGVYRAWRGASLVQEGWQVVSAWALTVAVLLLLGFASKTTQDYSRVVSVGWFIAAPAAMLLWRWGFRLALRALRARGYNTRRVAIAGATESGQRLAEALSRDPTQGLVVQGIYDDRSKRRTVIAQAPVVGSLEQLVEDARAGKLDVVYVALPLRAELRITTLIARLADTTATVCIVPEFYAYDLLSARWHKVGDIPVVSIFDSPFHGLGGWWKRLEDVVLGSIILTLIAIPMVFIAIAVKADTQGPVFFRQKRYGLNGRPIRVWKFRTMTVCEDGNDVRQATKNDQRVTRVGAFLRRTSLDELPQFFNVISGEMSIVGPRPHAIAHNEEYRAKIHGYMLRHKVKPGITGWAQVNGWRGETDSVDKMEKRIEHDLSYIHNWSLAWDLKIVYMTIFGRKTWRNAY